MKEKSEILPKVFYVYYFSVFMGMAIYNSFFSTFFTQAGMSPAQVGLLFGVAPLVGIVVQPLWGALTDRSRTKNSVLLLVIGGVMVSIVIFYLISAFFHGQTQEKLLLLAGTMILFSAFNNALVPLQDTITLDYIAHHGGAYGYARMSGTFGYAFMALLAGAILRVLPNSVFAIYFVTLCVILAAAVRLPQARGYRKKGEKGSVFEVLRDKEVFLILLLVMVQYTTMAFGHTFCGPYMLSLGGNSALIGLANTVQALGEVPFHIRWGRRLMQRVGIHRMLIYATLAGALRWGVSAVCTSPALFIVVTGLEGVMLVPLIVGVVEFINARVPARLKATGQTALTLFSVVFARTIGNIGGGALVDLFDGMGYPGMRVAYMILVPLSLAAAFGIGIPLLHCAKRQAQETIREEECHGN